MDENECIVIENLKKLDLPTPAELNYWNLRKQRVFWIDFEIDDNYECIELAKEIIRLNIEEKDEKHPEPIYIFIHSYGGDLEQAIFLCDLIESSSIPIVTIATGVAMSAGLLIFLSGARRYAFRHSKILIHSGSAALAGTMEQVDAAQAAYKKQMEQMKKYILEKTSIDESLYKKKQSKDWYISGESLIKLGIADKMVEKFADIK